MKQGLINKPKSSQQDLSIKQTQQYLKKHKIHQLCNEVLAQLIDSRSEKPREQMIAILKKIKDKSYYFKKSDFEKMFDSYDLFEDKSNNQISYLCLIQALTKINVHYDQTSFLNKYPQFKLQKGVKKSDFVAIMEKQYKSKIN